LVGAWFSILIFNGVIVTDELDLLSCFGTLILIIDTNSFVREQTLNKLNSQSISRNNEEFRTLKKESLATN